MLGVIINILCSPKNPNKITDMMESNSESTCNKERNGKNRSRKEEDVKP
jgi:hypothetical protein